jgi:hypothetical protein
MVWMSVEVAVKNGGKISETIVGTVSNGVKGAGKWLAKLPLYANFIPVYNKGDSEEGAKKVSLGGMWGAMQGFGNTFRSNKITEANKALGITNPERDKISDTEWNRLKTLDPSSDDSLLKDFAANLKRTGNYNQAIRSTGGLARNTDLKSALNNLNPTERQGLITRLEELTGDRLDAARASIGTTDPGGDSNNPSSADLTSRSIITVNNGAVEINGSSISGVNLSSLDSSQSNAIIQAINNLESNQDKEAALYQLFDSLNPNQEREIINAIPNNSDLRNLATVQEKIRQLEAQGDS